MDKYKIKDYTERLKKETYSNAQKMLYMWIKQEVITLNEYRALVKNIEVIHCCKSDSEQLPSFLYKSDGGLYFKHRENTDITEQWNEYLKTR